VADRPAESDERTMLRTTVRELIKQADPLAEARQPREGGMGFQAAGWEKLAGEIGAGLILVPEEHGGLGLGLADACAVLEELAAFCFAGPFLTSGVLAPLVLSVADQDLSADWAALGEGQVYTVADVHLGRGPGDWPLAVTAEQGPDGWRLSGTAAGVIHGMAADSLLVPARNIDGIGIWQVAADAPGQQRTPLVTLDLTRAQSDHSFQGTPARLVLTPSARSAGPLEAVASLVSVAVCAEQVGAARQVLTATLEYVRTRYQFGRAIGSFQAIKHRCVDLSIAVEGAVASYLAARDAAEQLPSLQAAGEPEIRRLSAIAAAWCSETFLTVAASCLQLHGGIGMAWEGDSHIYLRRAKASERLFGTPAQHRAALLELLR
jgi:alkylation response protein AidB-like acyl-CoA dehydrogenase